MSATHLPCPHDGCPGLEMHNGKPDGCGHPTITEGCPHAADSTLWKRQRALLMRGEGRTQAAIAATLGVGRTTVQRWTHEAFPRPTLSERLSAKLDKAGPIPAHRPELGRCWLWTGSRMPEPQNYGQIYGRGRQLLAHRASYEIAVGPIPDGLWVLHRCDNPPCVNPEHLFLGTAADNSYDMVHKGRMRHNPLTGEAWRRAHLAALPRGEANHNTKISDADVARLRARWTRGGVTQEALGVEFGLTQTHVSKIVRGLARV